jgi:hypothetical protein
MLEITQILGNIGEFVGALGVVATLIYLAVQVRHSAVLLESNNAAMAENTKLVRAAAIDRYSDAVSRWRGRLIESEDVAHLWQKALDEEHSEGVENLRLQNLLIDWVNTYRSNFNRAKVVGNEGLARQAVMSVVLVINQSSVIRDFWFASRPMNEVSAKDFVDAIEHEMRLNEETT